MNNQSVQKGPKQKGKAAGRKARPQRSAKSAQNGKRRRNYRNRNGQGSSNQGGFSKIQKSYLNLLEKHLEARKKYYDLFHRADPKQLAKLEKNFHRSIEELRQYEEGIKPEFKEKFDAMVNGLKLDTTYSSNHGLPVEAEPEVTEDQISDPHILPTQTNHEFKGDTEESVGTIDDYKKYKGIPEDA